MKGKIAVTTILTITIAIVALAMFSNHSRAQDPPNDALQSVLADPDAVALDTANAQIQPNQAFGGYGVLQVMNGSTNRFYFHCTNGFPHSWSTNAGIVSCSNICPVGDFFTNTWCWNLSTNWLKFFAVDSRSGLSTCAQPCPYRSVNNFGVTVWYPGRMQWGLGLQGTPPACFWYTMDITTAPGWCNGQ